MMKKSFLIILIGLYNSAMAQIPVELFGGHERTTVDIMFFKYFKMRQGENSRWLFFNRNRASIDYRMTKTTYLPQFGFTEAISYNHEKLKGFAPVMVVQVLNSGIYPKAGFQYAHINKSMTIFSWFVCELLRKPDLDYFILFRYTPFLTAKLKLFTQVESVNTFPTVRSTNFSFTQRFRLGLELNNYQFGSGADFNQAGNASFMKSCNFGVFIRYEF